MEYSPSQCYSGWLCQRFQEPPNCNALMWRLSPVPVLVHVDTWELNIIQIQVRGGRVRTVRGTKCPVTTRITGRRCILCLQILKDGDC